MHKLATDSYLSWGRAHRFRHEVVRPGWTDERLQTLLQQDKVVLPFGLGRSYGDSCLNADGVLIDMRGLCRFQSFNPETAVLRCEAGVTLAEILALVLPHGCFLPVTPGTKYVTVGGAVANDVHGKNHHIAGTFGCHVRRLGLVRSDGQLYELGPDDKTGLFAATVGGMGLTGLIIWVELQLQRVSSPLIEQEILKFRSLEEYQEIAATSDASFDYTVAWVDCRAQGARLGRGLFMRGRHVATENKESKNTAVAAPKLQLPFDAPSFLINSATVRLFNELYFNRVWGSYKKTVGSYEPFFYPLDAVGQWNRLYGPRGFFQYQFLLPSENAGMLREILSFIARSNQASPLVVLKDFGTRRSPGLMSFPRAGVTLALDFANRGAKTLKLMEDLDRHVMAAGGRVYPAKDGCMSALAFQSYFPQWRRFAEFIDPAFSSSFWRRVTR